VGMWSANWGEKGRKPRENIKKIPTARLRELPTNTKRVENFGGSLKEEEKLSKREGARGRRYNHSVPGEEIRGPSYQKRAPSEAGFHMEKSLLCLNTYREQKSPIQSGGWGGSKM